MAFLSPPNTPSLTNTSEHKCNVCQKLFKSNAGLARHNSVIQKYNILRKGLPVVPKNITKLFKNDLIYFIHRRLPNGLKNSGKKIVSVPCSESQFYAIFKNHIHYYSKKSGVCRCWFRGKEGGEKLNKIFGRTDWGIKNYDQNQKTYVVLIDNYNSLHQKAEVNPLALATAKKATMIKSKKSLTKCQYGDVTVEWKCRRDKEANGNICSAGFVYFHFYTRQAHIQMLN